MPLVFALRLWWALLLAVGMFAYDGDGGYWRKAGREQFLEHLVAEGCKMCEPLLGDTDELWEASMEIISKHFGCADADVLLPSLAVTYHQFLHEAGQQRAIFIDAGANIGRVTAKWLGALARSHLDIIGTRCRPKIACSGSLHTSLESYQRSPPSPVVVAMEPSSRNFAALMSNVRQSIFSSSRNLLTLQAALGPENTEAFLATSDTAVDEAATLMYDIDDPRERQLVQVLTLDDVMASVRTRFEDVTTARSVIFLLKLDIEGFEPTVLRRLGNFSVLVKFLVFEYNGNVWRESLMKIIDDLFAIDYFCFLITRGNLYPISGPFRDSIYEWIAWSNIFCGKKQDTALPKIIQMYSGFDKFTNRHLFIQYTHHSIEYDIEAMRLNRRILVESP